jgi:hypothetical protein
MAIVYAPFQKRVIEEAQDLNDKIAKLRVFLATCNRPGCPQVPADEVDRLQRQLDIMVSYVAVLEERIAAFSVTQ